MDYSKQLEGSHYQTDEKQLPCIAEAGNPSNHFAVAVLKQDTVVGHTSQLFQLLFSKVCLPFLFPFPLDKIQEVNFASLWKYVYIDIFTRFFSYTCL